MERSNMSFDDMKKIFYIDLYKIDQVLNLDLGISKNGILFFGPFFIKLDIDDNQIIKIHEGCKKVYEDNEQLKNNLVDANKFLEDNRFKVEKPLKDDNSSFNKAFLSSGEFDSWDENKKIIFLRLICRENKKDDKLKKEEYLDLVKDWSPTLKSMVFYLIDPEEVLNIKIDDLKGLKINEWPQDLRYEIIKSISENEKSIFLTDIKTADDLSKDEIFKTATPEIKYLLIKKFLYDNNGDVNLIIDLAKNNLDFKMLNVLSAEIYNKYKINCDFGSEIIRLYNNKNGKMTLADLQNLGEYQKLDGASKLRCLQLCDEKDLNINNFELISSKLDLNDFMTTEYFLPWFFKKLVKCNPGELLPNVILKFNWPIQIKSIAFESLPDYLRTQKNRHILFVPEEIKWLLYESQEKDNFMQNLSSIKSKLHDLISTSRPDFDLDTESRDEISRLRDKIDQANTPEEIKNLLIIIPDTMRNIIEKNIKSYVEVIKDIIEGDENTTKELLDYLYGKKDKLPDALNKDKYIASFLEKGKKTIQDINKQRKEKINEDDEVAGGFATAGLVGLAFDPVVLLIVYEAMWNSIYYSTSLYAWEVTVAFSAVISNPVSLIFLGATAALFVTSIAIFSYNHSAYADKNFYSKIFPYPDKIKQIVDYLKDAINKDSNLKKQVEKTQKSIEQKKYDNADLAERNINVFVNINQFKNAKQIIKQKNQDIKSKPMKKLKDKNGIKRADQKNLEG